MVPNGGVVPLVLEVMTISTKAMQLMRVTTLSVGPGGLKAQRLAARRPVACPTMQKRSVLLALMEIEASRQKARTCWDGASIP